MMHLIESMRRDWFLSACSLLLATLLVAYGSATSGSNSSGGSSNQGSGSGSTSSGTTATAVTGYGTANGCPSDAVVTSTSGNATIIVKPTQMQHQTISAHNGDSIEIQLPFGQMWTGPTTSQGILQLQGPAGYASRSANACIWRFVARGSGTAQLLFQMQALCQAVQPCPAYILPMFFDFNVK